MTDSLTVIIKDIELRSTQTRGKATRLYIQISLDGSPFKQTATVREKSNCTRWNDELVFVGSDTSALLMKAYWKRVTPWKKDEFVGAFTYTIGEITTKLNNGVFEEQLCKDTSDGSGLTDLLIKFAFSARPHELQAANGVKQATEAIGTLFFTPASANLLASVADNGTSTVAAALAFENTWGLFLRKFELFNQIVTEIAAIHPYASMAWSVISAANRVLINQKNRDERIIRLAGAMREAFEFAQDAEPLKKKVEKHDKIVALLLQQVTECCCFISDYSKPNSFWTRTAKNLVSDIDAKISAYEDKLRELKTAFLQDAAVQTEITIFRMVDVVQNTGNPAELITLNELPYAKARYSPGKGCISGTRVSLLEEIYDILNDHAEDAPRVCLLTGVAGSGKSSVAHTVARLYDEQKKLASSYCFSSTDVGRRIPQNLFSTIAQDLCDHDPHYQSALLSTVEKNRSLLMSLSPPEQLEWFIIQPSRGLDTIGSQLVVIIDALDESGSRDAREELLDALARQIAENALPKNLRFLITARPESDILSRLLSSPHLIHKEMGKIDTEVVDEDIELFIQHSVHSDSIRELSSHDREWCHKLVRRSEHLFQWAATACKFIQETGASPRRRFDLLLQGEDHAPMQPLYRLYRTILAQLFQSDDTQQSFQRVMAVILALHEPLSLTSLSALFNANEDLDVRRIVKPMGSLLDGVIDENEPIRLLHTSFHDFLLDEAYSLTFHVDVAPCHLPLGRTLLACMREKLRFNICDLKDSRLCNPAVPDLDERVKQAIPPYFSYACRYWMAHLTYAPCTPELLKEATNFFKGYFPYWLEAISLLSYSSVHSIPCAVKVCTTLCTWAKGNEISIEASEASQFIHVFSPILQASTPYLYLLAMLNTPSSSPLQKLWVDNLQRHISIISEHPARWQAALYELHGHTRAVNSVVYSPDGRYIISGSDDDTIRVWDATTGESVAGQFQGHTHDVISVAYSPNGRYIVSGSWDKTIRVWDAATGESVAGPFQGLTSCVLSVAYSPDGRNIVSGSWDGTIGVWDAITGESMGGLYQGHTSIVSCVAYSPSGRYIVSASHDKTVRVWDTTTGMTVTGPFQGHTESVKAVAYSPDGRYIVSGSADMTIRVWDAATGESVAGPFKGHVECVKSIAYSPDGRYIVSGSDDNTIRVWDMATGETVAGPFKGHTNFVTSVGYSPDGRYIVSGSWDNTIRVWDATIGENVEGPFQGHTDKIYSVVYSSDGKYIASSSRDKTIRIWDATTGKIVAGPFWGHARNVTSVAYSPDNKYIASGSLDNTIRIWNVTTGQIIADPFQGHTSGVTTIAYSPDSRHIVSGSWDHTIRVWDAATGEIVIGPVQEHKEGVKSVAYSPDGRHFVSGSDDNTIRVWDAATGRTISSFQGHTGGINTVVYSPDGRYILSGSCDKTIQIWDATTRETMANPLKGHKDDVMSVACSPDGRHIVSGSWDSTIRVWDVTTGETVAGPFQGHTGSVISVAYSPDGNYIVSGAVDGSIRVWKTQALISLPHLFINSDWAESSNIGSDQIASWNSSICQVDIDSSLLGESWTSCWKE